MSTLCIIPAKGNSTRLPKKNILKIKNHTLLGISILKAKACDLIDEVYVSSECSEVIDIAKIYGVEVNEVRPKELSKDPSTIVDVILYTIKLLEEKGQFFDTVCVLLPTSPLTQLESIYDALRLFKKSKERALLSVCKTEFPPYNAWLKNNSILLPVFPDSEFRSTKSTECPITYRSNGSILIVDVQMLKKMGHYNKTEILAFEMSQEESIDIDTQFEYNIAKALIETELYKIKGINL